MQLERQCYEYEQYRWKKFCFLKAWRASLWRKNMSKNLKDK